MSFAARLTDMHVCPIPPTLVTPPHVGGPIIQPSAPTVLIGKLPAACAGAMCTCVGPPDVILPPTTGFRAGVYVNKLPIAAMGDKTAHGGTIVTGCPTVLIGTGGVSTPSMPDIEMPDVATLAAEIESKTQDVLNEQAELEAFLEGNIDPNSPMALAAQKRLNELNDLTDSMDVPDF